MDALYAQTLPYLPPTLQDILLNPPTLSDPRSLWPLVRAAIPYTQYIIVLVAFYIVYSTIRSLAGYFTRFLRFSFKLGPILALVGWVMANSGQGSMDEVFQAVKEWTGISAPQGGARSPGVAGLFGQQTPVSGRTRSKNTKAKKRAGTGAGTAAGLGAEANDFLASMLGSATGSGAGGAGGDEWQDVVKNFVKNSLVKASGLEWLLGTNQPEARGAGAGRTR